MWSLTCVPTNVYKALYIQGPLQVQAPFSLCPSSTSLRVVLALDGFDSRSRQGQTQRLMRVFPPPTQRLDADADGPIGPMG